jgi:thymidylate synthase (FAD)
MNVKLISYSQPTEEMITEGLADAQELVAYCARVSNPSNQMNKETSEKLIKYLIEIETTRDIAHQIVRHRSFSFQEFSQRYADPKEFGDQFVMREARMQDPKNRQNSIENENMALEDEWANKQMAVIETAKMAYDWAIENGIAKEQARAVLPEGNTKTRLYMNGTVRSWVHYIDLRGANGTQKEHMEIAHSCAKVIAEVFPIIDKLDH